jgi:tetratricopeptide (TPR) repeat protein
MARMSKSDWNGAIAEFNRAIELDPNFAEAIGNRGAAKGALKDFDGALADYDRAIKLMPTPTLKKVRNITLKQKRSQKS